MLRSEPRSGSTPRLHAIRYRLFAKLRHDDIGEPRDVSSMNGQSWAIIAFMAYPESSPNDPHFVVPCKSSLRVHAIYGGQQAII